MSDASGNKVYLTYLLLVSYLNDMPNYNWVSIVLTCLNRALDHIVDFNEENTRR